MRKTKPIQPAPSLLVPADILYLLLLSRSRVRVDEFIYNNKEHIKEHKILAKKLYYPDDAMAWKDRAEHAHLVVLEERTDPPFFREEVGRVKLFFPSHLIIKVSH